MEWIAPQAWHVRDVHNGWHECAVEYREGGWWARSADLTTRQPLKKPEQAVILLAAQWGGAMEVLRPNQASAQLLRESLAEARADLHHLRQQHQDDREKLAEAAERSSQVWRHAEAVRRRLANTNETLASIGRVLKQVRMPSQQPALLDLLQRIERHLARLSRDDQGVVRVEGDGDGVG